jgi:hypothetical protein
VVQHDGGVVPKETQLGLIQSKLLIQPERFPITATCFEKVIDATTNLRCADVEAIEDDICTVFCVVGPNIVLEASLPEEPYVD